MFPLSDFLLYCFVTAYTPGANNLLSMSNATRLGFRRSFRFNLGITAGFFVVMSVCAAFCSTLYSLLPKARIFLQIFGAAYMLYLAWKVWRSSSDFGEKGEAASGFRTGMLLQFMNPKIYIYAITTLTLYILPLYQSAAALVGFVLVLTAIGASGSYAWALFGSAFCRFFSRHEKTVNLIMTLLLIYCAASLFR